MDFWWKNEVQIPNPSQIDQNWGQERSKNDPASKTSWVPPNRRYIGLETLDLWNHLADFGTIFDPIGFQMGVLKSTIFEQKSQKHKKKEVQEAALTKTLFVDRFWC